MELSSQPPNPRVQRTRPCASLRGSPLTRHPLGAVVIMVALVAFGGCRHTVADYSFRVEGTVVDNTAAALSNVRVTLQIHGVAYQAVTEVSRTETYTDVRGHFGFAYLTHEPGLIYSLWFDKQGFESESREGASLAESPFEIKMQRLGA